MAFTPLPLDFLLPTGCVWEVEGFEVPLRVAFGNGGAWAARDPLVGTLRVLKLDDVLFIGELGNGFPLVLDACFGYHVTFPTGNSVNAMSVRIAEVL